jgi:hypothetical protein
LRNRVNRKGKLIRKFLTKRPYLNNPRKENRGTRSNSKPQATSIISLLKPIISTPIPIMSLQKQKQCRVSPKMICPPVGGFWRGLIKFPIMESERIYSFNACND